MHVQELDIPGLLLIEPRRHGDARGFFSETYNARALAEAGVTDAFVQDNHSRSERAGVLRGLHFQLPPAGQAKLLRVIRGRVLDVVVDLRRGPTYGRHAQMELSERNWRQLYIPEGFAHGYLTLEPGTEVQYKVSDFYAPEHEAGLMWNDPDLCVAWPEVPGGYTLSGKDENHPPFADFVSPWRYDGAGG